MTEGPRGFTITRVFDAPRELVFKAYQSGPDPNEPIVELVTVVLTDLGGGKTRMEFEQRGHLSDETYVRTGEGWSVFFDSLADHMAQAKEQSHDA